MNKEVKDLIEGIKKSIEVYEKIETPKDGLVLRINCYYTKLLLDYINQLETNRDEALKRNEQVIKMIEDGRSREQFLPYLKNQKIILERGKE